MRVLCEEIKIARSLSKFWDQVNLEDRMGPAEERPGAAEKSSSVSTFQKSNTNPRKTTSSSGFILSFTMDDRRASGIRIRSAQRKLSFPSRYRVIIAKFKVAVYEPYQMNDESSDEGHIL